MKTDFFTLKNIYRLFAGFFVCFVFCMLLYSGFLLQIKRVPLNVRIYYLVEECDHVEAGAEWIKLSGGAGYILQEEGKPYVILSAYLDGEYADSVFLSVSNERTQIISKSVEYLYFKSPCDKRNANVYQSALLALYDLFKGIERGIIYLQNGGTQENAKELFSIWIRQISHLSQIYEKDYVSFSKVCKQMAEDFESKNENIIFATDFRYLFCVYMEEFFNLTDKFSL